MTTYLSSHFTLEEMTHSQQADRLDLDNSASPAIIAKLKVLAYGMETVRLLLGKPITVSSGYRSIEVNRSLGSKDSSQHVRGEACDFVCHAYGPPAMIVSAILASGVIEFDQLILEFATNKNGGWVHISFTERPRMQALVIDKNGTRPYA